MNKLYTLLITLFLAGCSPQGDAFASTSRAFQMACTYSTMETSLTNDGDKLTITATCTKAK